jgi:hypothetical protein
MKNKDIRVEIRVRFMEAMEEIVHTGIPRSEFMECIGDHQQNYAQFINGKRYPTIANIYLLFSIYGYNPTWIITGDGSKKMVAGASPLERLGDIEREIKDLKKLLKKI